MRLDEAEAAERTAFAEIGALGERELADVKAWIASGCEGAQPRPNAEARRALTEHLLQAMAAREAAGKAADGRGRAPAPDAPAAIEIAATRRGYCGATPLQ